MRRTEGKWELSEKYVQFAAAGVMTTGPEFYLLAVNDLYGTKGDEFIEKMLDRGHRLLLDSGIFNLTNAHMRATGCSMNEALALPPEEIQGFDKLFDRYVELTTRWGDQLWGYIELDQGGAASKRAIRARLHDMGLDPIPVYHPVNDGWDYFDELGGQFERMCVGNVVQANAANRVKILHAIWERRRAYPKLWVHALGLTPNETCLSFPPDSCDSSSWVNGLRYSKVFLGTAALKRQGWNSDSGLRYSSDAETVRDSERHDRPDSRCQTSAIGVYADEVEFTTLIWRRIQEDRAAELGEDTRPAYLTKETALCPA